MTRKQKVTLSIFVALLAALAVVIVAQARAHVVVQDSVLTFCAMVYHKGVPIAKVCTSWNIVTRDNPDQVKALTNGTRTILWKKSGYTAILGPQSCVPLKEWTDEVVCKSTTKFKQGGWPIGGIKQTCWFDANAMVCDVRKVLAPEAK